MKARMRVVVLELLFFVAMAGAGLGCQDRAEPGLLRCQQLERDGKLPEAAIECERAYDADPSSPMGKSALSRKMDLERKLAEIVPATVSRDWCARLRARLEGRLGAEAQQKYPEHDPAYVRQVVTEHLMNVEYNCIQDIGKPTAGLWQCRWDEHFHNYKDCDELRKRRTE